MLEDFDKEGFAARISAVLAGESVNGFATKAGLSEASLRQYLSGSLPKIDKAAAIAAAGGVSLGWLVNGRIQTKRDADLTVAIDEARLKELEGAADTDRESAEYAAVLRQSIDVARRFGAALEKSGAAGDAPQEAWPRMLQSMTIGGNTDFIAVPQLDVRASAGAGSVAAGISQEYVGAADVVAFREGWLRQLGVSARFARILVCDGDSMSPTIGHGDMMLVDTAIREIVQDGIYVLVYAGLLKVKRVQMRRDGILMLKSDNAAYDTEEVPMAEQPELIIEGRVRWAGGAI